MRPRHTPARAARAIGATTAASGAALVLTPELALRLLGAQTPEPAPYLFRVVGVFMVLSGGTLIDGIGSAGSAPVALRWSVAQKAAAATAVALGVRAGHYRRRALAVAAFDGASAVALAVLARRPR
jgi:hypothetical protein